MSELIVNPTYIEVGTPITVSMGLMPGLPPPIFLYNHQAEKALSLSFSQDAGNQWTTQFALYEEGVYKLSVGEQQREFTVHKKTDLGFSLEFWTVALISILALGGLIVWSGKRKISRDGSF